MFKEKDYDFYDCFKKFLKDPEAHQEKLVAKLESMRSSWASEKEKHLNKIWRNNVLFYSGNQYVRDYLNNANTFRVKLRENHTNNIIQRICAIAVQNLPIVRVFPNSDSFEDVQNAQNTEAYLKYFWRTKKIEKKLIKLVQYSLIFGHGFFYRKWNPDLGDKMVLNADETLSGEPEIKEYRGDIDLSIDDPYKMNVRPGIDELDDMFDIIRSAPANRAMLESKYGEIDDTQAMSRYNIQSNSYYQDEESCLVHEYYHKPTPWFEEGCYISWTGKKILIGRVAKESEKVLPVGDLGFDKVPMRFWRMSSIENVMDLQEQLNRAASMIVENRNLMARPRVIAAHQAKVAAQSISDRPGDILRYDATGPEPKFVIPPFNFGEFANHKADLRVAMQNVSGMTGASRGEIPAGIRTALALQMTIENDRSQYLMFIKNLHQAIIDMSYGILLEAAENFDEEDPRVIKVEGAINTTRTFYGRMVPSPLDIGLEETNRLGWTAAGRIEAVTELVKAGVIRDENKVFEMLQMNSTEPAFEYQKINRITQQKEILQLDQGNMVDIGPEDDDHIHLEEITKVMATYEWKFKPQIVKEAYVAHVNQHKARLAQADAMKQPAPNAGGLNMAGQMMAPEPGQNLAQLLKSPRAG